MIYLDSCAIVSLIVEEDETPDLVRWIRDHNGVLDLGEAGPDENR